MLPIVARKKMLASDLTTKLKMSRSDTEAWSVSANKQNNFPQHQTFNQ